MMLSVMVVGAGAAFSDQSKIKNTEAVDACTALNIIGGYPDGSFKPEGNITRAEVTKMICVALNGGKNPAVSTNTTPTFSDVRGNANAAWAEGYIESCAAQGIVSGVGGGKFAPNGNVTGVQLAKMLLVSLGYKSENEGFTGNAWATNVNMRAAQKGLYKGLETMDTAAAITRDNAAQMVWNALQAYEVEYKTTLTTDSKGQLTSQITVQDKVVGATNDKITMLEDKYDVDKLEAVVVANEYGALEGNVLKEGKTQLKVTTVNDDDWKYDPDNKNAVNYSGTYDVTTSLDLLGKKVILFAKDKKTVVGSLIASTDNAVATTTEEKTFKETYDLADDADITIVPGTTKVSANYGNATTLASFNKNDDTNDYNLAGQALTIIDNDDDGNADYIIQVSYRLGEVTKYSTSGKGSITVKTADGNKVYNDSSDVVGFSDVAKDDYVIVTEIGGKLYVNKAKTVTGKLTAYKTNDSLTVDGTKYTVAGVLNGKDNATIDTDEFNAAGTYGTSSTLNKDATFYLDNNGYVVAVSSSTGTSDDFAFVWGIERGNFNGDYSVKVTLSDGTTGEYVLTDKDGSIGKTMVEDDSGNISYTSSTTQYGASSNKVDPTKKIYTYSINSSKEITLEEIASTKLTHTPDGAFDFSKNKAKITSGTKTLYGDKETVFFNVEYKDNKTDIKKVNVYTGIASAPSITATGAEGSKLNSYLVATSATGTTAAAVVTLDATTSANGDYLYLYGYKGTNNDGDFYRAVVDGKLLDGKDNNNYLFTDESKTTKLADGVYEYTVTADGLYQIKSAPANVAAGVITTLSGNSVIVNDVEYTLKDSTKIATIDGNDTTVGDKLSKDDLVVLVYDQNGSDKDLTGAFIVNASAEATITNVNGATVDIDGTDITVTGTVNAASASQWGFNESTKSFIRFKLEAPAGVTVDKTKFALTVAGPNKTNSYTGDALESDNSLDVVLGLEAGANNKTFTITAKWNENTTVVYTVDVNATVVE